MKEIEQKITGDGLPQEQSISLLLDKIEQDYGHRNSQEREVYALKLKSLMSEDSATYEEYEKDAGEKAKDLFENLYTGSNFQKARETGLIDSLVAHGSITLALQIFYDPDKPVSQKRNELAWIRTLTDSPEIELSPVESLAAKLQEAVTPEAKKTEKIPSRTNQLKKRLSSAISTWIKKEKVRTTAKFAVGAAAGIVGANLSELEPGTEAKIALGAHLGLISGRYLLEGFSRDVEKIEQKHPRFANLSRKIAGEKAVSGLLKKIGESAGKLQKNPIFLGFTAGVLGHSAYEAVTGTEELLASEPEAKIETSEPQVTAAETLEPSVSVEPSPDPTPEITPEIPEVQETPVEEPVETPVELTQPTPTFETAEYSVQSGDTLSEIVAEVGGDPYGTDMTNTVLQSQDILLEHTRLGHDSARQLLGYLAQNPEVTWRQAINENLIDMNTGKRVADLFSEALRIIRPGDLFNIVAGP